MRLGVAFAVILTAGLGGLGCGGSGGTVSGKVLVDGAPAQGQEVALQGGRGVVTATTGADGSYQLPDVPEGAYLLSVDVASTLERHLQVAVAVKAPVTVPDLTFTSVATLSGTVTDATEAPVSGAQVQVLGTQVSGSTDAAGRFVFSAVPAGTRTVAVTSASGSAQLEVTLAQGESKDVALTLAAAPPATVTGQAGFFARTDLSVIEVSIPAAGVSTHATADGQYSLSVPPGSWDLYAKAPYYPSQKIGHVQAASGETVLAPPATLSLYTELPTFGVQNGAWYLADAYRTDARTAVLLAFGTSSGALAFYAFDLERHSLKLISVDAEPVLSADGKWAALVGPLGGAVVLNLETSENFVVPATGHAEELRFSTDSSLLLFETLGTPDSLYVVKLADQTVTQLPAYQELDLNRDRWLVQTTHVAPITWKLVTPQGIGTAFTNVPTVTVASQDLFSDNALPAFGIEACALPPCRVDVLGPAATAAVASNWTPAGGSFATHTAMGTWLLLGDGTQLALIDTVAGGTTLLPLTASDASFSLDGKRFAYFAQAGTQLFEHALPLPDPSTLTALVSSAGVLRGAFSSNSRFVGFDDTPTTGTAYRFTVDSGELSRDPDYTAGSGGLASGLFARWLGTDGKARFSLGDGPVYTAPEGQTVVPSQAAAELKVGGTSGAATGQMGHKLAVSWSDGKTWFYNGDAAPRSQSLFLASSGFTPFLDNLLRVSGLTGTETAMDFDSGQVIALKEPGRVDLSLDLSLLSPPTLLLSHSVNADGDEVGGAYALLPRFIPF